MEQSRLIPGWLKGAIAVIACSAAWSFANAPEPMGYDLRINDRDWNRVNDFWTTNLSNLYTMTSTYPGKVVTRCLEHFDNPACTHPLKDWPQQSCPLRMYWTTID